MISFVEGTFTNRKVKMGFFNHGGMWSDLIVMSTMAGFASPYFKSSLILILISVVAALVITVIAHIQWADWFRAEGITGHIFPAHESGKWCSDISTAGWMHVFVMTTLLAASFMYALSPAPMHVVVTVAGLLTMHVVIGTIQPSWYCTGVFWAWRYFKQPLFVVLLIWGVAAIKIV